MGVPGQPANIGEVLRGVFGTASGSVVASGFLHKTEYTPRSSDLDNLHPLPSYTMEIYRAGTTVNSSFRYDGVQFGRLQLSIQPNQAVQATIGVIARRFQFITKTTPTFPGSPLEPFLFDTASLQMPAGSGNTRIEALTISYDNLLEGIPTINNSKLIGHIKRTGAPQVRISGTIAFFDLQEFNDFINQTERQMVINCFKANSFGLLIDIPRMVYSAVPVSVGGGGRITSNFTGIGRYHSGSGTAIKLTLDSVNSGS